MSSSQRRTEESTADETHRRRRTRLAGADPCQPHLQPHLDADDDDDDDDGDDDNYNHGRSSTRPSGAGLKQPMQRPPSHQPSFRRFYDLPTSSTQVAATSSGGGGGEYLGSSTPPPPPPPAKSQPQSTQKAALGNVPTIFIVQLEKANRTIAAQTLEIERLRSGRDQSAESSLLRSQVVDLEREMQKSRDRFLEQEELLAEMNREMDVLLREKRAMQNAYMDLEKKYKRAKLASKELTRILENDVCALTPSRDAADESATTSSANDVSLLERSRALARKRDADERLQRAEDAIQRKSTRDDEETKGILQRVLLENEGLLFELEKERQLATSLHDDLELSRRTVLDRDELVAELNEKLRDAEQRANQCENERARTSSDLALERARCDALTLELHELDAIFTQTQSTAQAYAVENEQLDVRCRQAHQTIVSLNAKLEAQGVDLITTKRTLRAIQQH